MVPETPSTGTFDPAFGSNKERPNEKRSRNLPWLYNTQAEIYEKFDKCNFAAEFSLCSFWHRT
jgi:hypothetical protein